MSITPGGNPICERCGNWYGLGRGSEHLTDEDCINNLTRIFQLNGPDEFPEGYYRQLAEQHYAKGLENRDNV